MTQMVQRTQFRLSAKFETKAQAETVCEAINEALFDAAREVDELFKMQGGIADVSDIAHIYETHGFRNESGWQQISPLAVDAESVVWDIPEGMVMKEAEQLLTIFGAVAMSMEKEDEDELLRQVPHPAALFLSEIEDIMDFDEEELGAVFAQEKKVLH